MMEIIPQLMKVLHVSPWMLAVTLLLARFYKQYKERHEKKLHLRKEQMDAVTAIMEKDLGKLHPLIVDQVTRFVYGDAITKDVFVFAVTRAAPSRFIEDYILGRRFIKIEDGVFVGGGGFETEDKMVQYLKRRKYCYYCFCTLGLLPLPLIPFLILNDYREVLMPFGVSVLYLITLALHNLDLYINMQSAMRLLKTANQTPEPTR